MKSFLYAISLFSSVSLAQDHSISSVVKKKNPIHVQSSSSISSEIKKKCDEEYSRIRFFRAQTPEEKNAWFQSCYHRQTVPSVLDSKK